MTAAPGQRKQNALAPRLHAGHFAFMRAVVQGLDTRQSWDRYLRLEGEHDDIRTLRRTVQWIRDEFAAAARRYSRHGVARLIKIEADRLAEGAPRLPPLEEFALEHGLEEFSQAEQLEHYKACLGSPPASQARRRRIIARQLNALRWLEELVAIPPRPEDPPSYWLHPDLARRLEEAGIVSLEQLVRQINGVGYRWWAGIPGVGAGKAERVVGWLRSHESSLRLRLGTHADQPRGKIANAQLQDLVASGAAIVPLEKFVPPAGLDGAEGLFRAPKSECRLPADTDITAVLTWVASKASASGASTQRSYRKEGERFLLWIVLARGKPLSSAGPDDCATYLQFLADPQPAEQWCGPRGREKWSPLWRPFEGPLSESARRHAVVILKNLFGFLVAHRYLMSDPWQAVALPQARARQPRDFAQAHWLRLEQYVDALPRTSANARAAFALRLIRATGLRLGEAVNATVDDLREIDGRTYLQVRGRKGKKTHAVVNRELLGHLADYLQTRGLDPDPCGPLNKGAYLLGPAVDLDKRAPWSPAHLRAADPKSGIAAGTLYDQLKNHFAACAATATDLSPNERELLQAASTGWLRTQAGVNKADE